MKSQEVNFQFEASDASDPDALFCDLYDVTANYEVTERRAIGVRYIVNSIELLPVVGGKKKVKLNDSKLNRDDKLKLFQRAHSEIEKRLDI